MGETACLGALYYDVRVCRRSLGSYTRRILGRSSGTSAEGPEKAQVSDAPLPLAILSAEQLQGAGARFNLAQAGMKQVELSRALSTALSGPLGGEVHADTEEYRPLEVRHFVPPRRG